MKVWASLVDTSFKYQQFNLTDKDEIVQQYTRVHTHIYTHTRWNTLNEKKILLIYAYVKYFSSLKSDRIDKFKLEAKLKYEL